MNLLSPHSPFRYFQSMDLLDGNRLKMFEAKVQCPRCHKIWTLPQGSPGTYCDCHLYCEDGTQPRDCNMTEQNYNGQLGWPVGLNQDGDEGGEKVLRRTYYCSTHGKYSYKEPIFLEVNWEEWYQKRALKKFREVQW
jgi:hypothetical protein